VVGVARDLDGAALGLREHRSDARQERLAARGEGGLADAEEDLVDQVDLEPALAVAQDDLALGDLLLQLLVERVLGGGEARELGLLGREILAQRLVLAAQRADLRLEGRKARLCVAAEGLLLTEAAGEIVEG